MKYSKYVAVLIIGATLLSIYYLDNFDFSSPSNFAVDSMVEAESGDLNEYVLVINDSVAGNGQYVETPDGMGWDDLGVMKYTFTIPEDETYTLWMYVRWSDWSGNSYAVAWDVEANGWINDPENIVGDYTLDVWHWINNEYLLTSGTHTLVFQTREDGVALDRLYISSNPVYEPV